MLRITDRGVRVHADEIGISNLTLAEQDIRIYSLLDRIFSDEFLHERLVLKGGTAINKVYLRAFPRLSVDLDFNHIGPKEQVLSEKRKIRETILQLLQEQDESYHTSYSRGYRQTTIAVRYKPLFGAEQHLKTEISHVERFPILPLEHHELRDPASGKAIEVQTCKLDELISTKLRAFYERLSGRDLYDLHFVFKMGMMDPVDVRKMLIYYVYGSRKVFNPRTFLKRIEGSARNNEIVDDVSGYVRNDVEFSIRQAASEFLHNYSFLQNIDERDNLFISLARQLLQKGAVPRQHLELIQQVEYPFRFLFGESEKRNRLSKEAWNIKTEDIRPFLKSRRKTEC